MRLLVSCACVPRRPDCYRLHRHDACTPPAWVENRLREAVRQDRARIQISLFLALACWKCPVSA